MPAADAPHRTVAHLVTPYLFTTGSWIHAQLVYNREFRPVVLTQRVENREVFPFDPVHDLSGAGAGIRRPAHLFSKYVLGSYPAAPYLDLLERERVDLIHAHAGWEGARAVRLARRSGRPFVVSFYGRDATLLPRHPFWRRLYRRLFAGADRVVAEGPFMGKTLEAIGAPPERIRVVHLGIALEKLPFRERNRRAGDPVVGLISASFREKKGIAYGLEAVAQVVLDHPELRLRIIGDGPLRPAVETRVARPDLRGKVELLGYLPYPAYLEELGRADFLLAPSVTARDGDSEGGAPVCLLEAQASGMPILATQHCDIPEVTVPGESGWLSPERDAAAMAANLRELLAHPERWSAMGRAGRAHVEREFDIRTQVRRMNELYAELL